MFIAQMNCGLLGDQHERSPYHRIQIEIFHFVLWLVFELSSQICVDFHKMWYVGTRYAESVRQLRIVLVVDAQIFSGKFPFWKTLTLARVCSSEFPHTFAQFCICQPHLRT